MRKTWRRRTPVLQLPVLVVVWVLVGAALASVQVQMRMLQVLQVTLMQAVHANERVSA